MAITGVEGQEPGANGILQFDAYDVQRGVSDVLQCVGT